MPTSAVFFSTFCYYQGAHTHIPWCILNGELDCRTVGYGRAFAWWRAMGIAARRALSRRYSAAAAAAVAG
jgi:hypothetical protein